MIGCVRGCTVKRRHLAGCEDQARCWGCEPRAADHGILCLPCHNRLELMLHDAPTVDAWLTVNLGTLGSVAAKEDFERAHGAQTGSPAPLQPAVFDVRQQLRDQLASWTDELCSEQTDLRAPKRHTTEADAGYLERMLRRVESMVWVGDLWDELGQTMTDAHALCPWRPALKRRPGVPCPECGAAMLAVFGGEEHTTCLSCRYVMTPDQYGIWVRIRAMEAQAS